MVELENGKKLSAEWLQDNTSGAFCLKAGGEYIAKQGGFCGFIPEHVIKSEDGTFKFDFRYGEGKTTYYSLSNPFRNELKKEHKNTTLNEKIFDANIKGRMEGKNNIKNESEFLLLNDDLIIK